LTERYDIPKLYKCATVDALQTPVELPIAVQLRVNEELVRVTLGPVETTSPSLSVHW